MLFDRYDMIVPQVNICPEYETFYMLYGQNIKNLMLSNQMFKEIKEQLPNLLLEFTENIQETDKSIDTELTMLMLKRNKGKREEYTRSVSTNDYQLLINYYDNDIEKLIDHITNYQQIIALFSAFDGTLISYLHRKLNNNDKISQSNILLKLNEVEPYFFSKYQEMTNNSLSFNELNILWNYYTQVRNLYAHKNGIIDKEFINKLNNTLNSYSKSIIDSLHDIENKIDESTCYIIKAAEKDLFSLNELSEGKIFVIKEHNIRFFREFLINIWETVYVLQNPNTTQNLNITINNSSYTFQLCNTIKENEILQKIPQNITSYHSSYNVSGYLCPICRNNTVFLYKIKISDIYIDKLINPQIATAKYKARNSFTCPLCKSFFFPAYGHCLSENNGFEITKMDEYSFFKLLKMLEQCKIEGSF